MAWPPDAPSDALPEPTHCFPPSVPCSARHLELQVQGPAKGNGDGRTRKPRRWLNLKAGMRRREGPPRTLGSRFPFFRARPRRKTKTPPAREVTRSSSCSSVPFSSSHPARPERGRGRRDGGDDGGKERRLRRRRRRWRARGREGGRAFPNARRRHGEPPQAAPPLRCAPPPCAQPVPATRAIVPARPARLLLGTLGGKGGAREPRAGRKAPRRGGGGVTWPLPPPLCLLGGWDESGGAPFPPAPLFPKGVGWVSNL